MITIDQVEQIAESLYGSCASPDDFTEEVGLPPDFKFFIDTPNRLLDHFDSLVFTCEICGWWVEADDRVQNEEYGDICVQCDGELEEEED